MAAAPVIAGVAGLAGSAAEFGGGLFKRKKERAAQRESLAEQLATTRENIASMREQKQLLGEQTQSMLAAMRRGEAEELGTQTASYAGGGVKIGAGGTPEAVESYTKRVRGEERDIVQKQADVQRRQMEREIARLGRQEEQVESALGGMKKGGLFGIGKKKRSREVEGIMQKYGLEWTPGTY